MLNEHLCYMRAFDHIYMEKVCYKFLIVVIIIIIIIIIVEGSYPFLMTSWNNWRKNTQSHRASN